MNKVVQNPVLYAGRFKDDYVPTKFKIIPEDKKPCKGCTTPNICKDMGVWNTCKLQKS